MLPKSLIGMDPPEHTPRRQLYVRELTVRRMQRLRPRIQAIVDEYLDEVARSPRPVDLVTAFALPADLLRELAEVADRCPGRAIRVTTRD